MPAANKRSPQEEVTPNDGIPVDATTIPVGNEETVFPSATATVTEVPTITQSISGSAITPTTTSQSLSSGLFTVLTQMTLAPSSSLPVPSGSVSGTVIRPVSSSIRPTVIAPVSASPINSLPNGLLMFTLMVILFMRFFKH